MEAGALVARRTYNGQKHPSPRGGAYILSEGSDGERTSMHHIARHNTLAAECRPEQEGWRCGSHPA